jgi:hypothetical protein
MVVERLEAYLVELLFGVRLDQQFLDSADVLSTIGFGMPAGRFCT